MVGSDGVNFMLVVPLGAAPRQYYRDPAEKSGQNPMVRLRASAAYSGRVAGFDLSVPNSSVCRLNVCTNEKSRLTASLAENPDPDRATLWGPV
jgi:hypothetical protein